MNALPTSASNERNTSILLLGFILYFILAFVPRNRRESCPGRPHAHRNMRERKQLPIQLDRMGSADVNTQIHTAKDTLLLLSADSATYEVE